MHPELYDHLTQVEHDIKHLVGHGAAKNMSNWRRMQSADALIRFVQKTLRGPARFDSLRIEKLGGLSLERVVLDFVPHLFTEEDLALASETLERGARKAPAAPPKPAPKVLSAEFDCAVDACGCVALPADVAQQLPANTRVRVVLRWTEEDAKAAVAAALAEAEAAKAAALAESEALEAAVLAETRAAEEAEVTARAEAEAPKAVAAASASAASSVETDVAEPESAEAEVEEQPARATKRSRARRPAN